MGSCICPACPTDTCLVSVKVVQFSLQHTACSYGTALAAGSSTALAAPAIWRCTNGASSPASFSAPETWWPLISCRTAVTFPRPPAPPDSRHCSCRSSSSSSPVGNAQVREAPAIEMPAVESADQSVIEWSSVYHHRPEASRLTRFLWVIISRGLRAGAKGAALLAPTWTAMAAWLAATLASRRAVNRLRCSAVKSRRVAIGYFSSST